MTEEQTTAAADVNEAQPQIPKIWNPNAAVNWSILFTPVFGAWLHAKNWHALGDEDQAAKSMYWVYGGFVFLFVCLFLPDSVGYLPGLIFLVAWYLLSARKQTAYVKERLSGQYERKPWKTPLKYAAIGLVSFLVLALLFSGCGSGGGSAQVWDKVSWGMTKEDVKGAYPEAEETDDGMSAGTTTIAGIEFSVAFAFDDGGSINQVQLVTLDQRLEQAGKLYALLQEKYGEGTEETYVKNVPNFMTDSFMQFQVEKYTWYNDRTRITLERMEGASSGMSKVTLTYDRLDAEVKSVEGAEKL